MNTFLPFPDYKESAKCLDRARLGKQRVECKQILKALKTGTGWANHPATLMWKGYESELVRYAITICQEWRSRGYNDSLLIEFKRQDVIGPTIKPWWLGIPEFHLSHRVNLWIKDPTHYFAFRHNCFVPYWWPTNEQVKLS